MGYDTVKIGYDRTRIAELVEDEWAEHVEWLAEFDLTNRERRHEGVEFARTLVKDLTDCGGIWKADGCPDLRVDVFADYSCDSEGSSTNEGCLSLSVFLGSSAGIADVGIDSLSGLPHSEFGTVFDVLDGVVALLNESIARIARVLAPAESELALRVVPFEAVRSEADDDPDLPATERDVLRGATDEQITDALSWAWRGMEDQFWSLHDSLQSAAKGKLIDDADLGGCV